MRLLLTALLILLPTVALADADVLRVCEWSTTVTECNAGDDTMSVSGGQAEIGLDWDTFGTPVNTDGTNRIPGVDAHMYEDPGDSTLKVPSGASVGDPCGVLFGVLYDATELTFNSAEYLGSAITYPPDYQDENRGPVVCIPGDWPGTSEEAGGESCGTSGTCDKIVVCTTQDTTPGVRFSWGKQLESLDGNQNNAPEFKLVFDAAAGGNTDVVLHSAREYQWDATGRCVPDATVESGQKVTVEP